MSTIFRENNAPKMVIQKKLIEPINRLFSPSLSIQLVFIESRKRETKGPIICIHWPIKTVTLWIITPIRFVNNTEKEFTKNKIKKLNNFQSIVVASVGA
jgi:hypothetical protein